MLLKYAKDGELEPGNCSYSTVMCEADKDGGIITNVRDLSAGLSKTTAQWLKGLEVPRAAEAWTPQEASPWYLRAAAATHSQASSARNLLNKANSVLRKDDVYDAPACILPSSAVGEE